MAYANLLGMRGRIILVTFMAFCLPAFAGEFEQIKERISQAGIFEQRRIFAEALDPLYRDKELNREFIAENYRLVTQLLTHYYNTIYWPPYIDGRIEKDFKEILKPFKDDKDLSLLIKCYLEYARDKGPLDFHYQKFQFKTDMIDKINELLKQYPMEWNNDLEKVYQNYLRALNLSIKSDIPYDLSTKFYRRSLNAKEASYAFNRHQLQKQRFVQGFPNLAIKIDEIKNLKLKPALLDSEVSFNFKIRIKPYAPSENCKQSLEVKKNNRIRVGDELNISLENHEVNEALKQNLDCVGELGYQLILILEQEFLFKNELVSRMIFDLGQLYATDSNRRDYKYLDVTIHNYE